jgi:hypothetical protein
VRERRDTSASTDPAASGPSTRDPGKSPAISPVRPGVQRQAAPDAERGAEPVATETYTRGAATPLIAHGPVQLAKDDDKNKGKNQHRGRIQVQGGGVEISRPWTQDAPRSKADGQADLTSLKGELTKKQLKIRDQAFEKAAKFINDTLHTCPPDVHRTFQNKEVIDANGDERVDVEILAGTAFQ